MCDYRDWRHRTMKFKKFNSLKINDEQLLHLMQHESEFKLNETASNLKINFAVNSWQLCDLIADNESRNCSENNDSCELTCLLWN